MAARNDDDSENPTVNQNKSSDEQKNPTSPSTMKSNDGWGTIVALDKTSGLGEEVVQSEYLKKEYDQFDFKFK